VSAAHPDATTPDPPNAPNVASSHWSRGDGPAVGESCDYCGALTLTWRKCKLICLSCAQINKSCADL
jgi:hypothetical protein